MTIIAEDSQKGSGYRLAVTEKENLSADFEKSWAAPQRLRKHHKKQVKQYKSWKQGHDGDIAMCIFCKRLFPIDMLEVHHHDHIISNNELDNLDPACDPCNNSDNARALAKRLAAHRHADQHKGVSEDSSPALPHEQMNNGSPELAKHHMMRPRFDKWVRDIINGPFAKFHKYPRDTLAEMAPYACSTVPGQALGSSKTYLKFIKEDCRGGILSDELEEGVVNVMLNHEQLKKIQEQTGQ